MTTSRSSSLKRPVFLNSGYVVRVETEKLGHLVNKLVQAVADILMG